MSIRPPSPLLPSAFNPLRKHLTQSRIVLVLLDVVYANMPIIHQLHPTLAPTTVLSDSPLQIIRPRIPMLLIRTERTDVSGTVVHKTMPYHLVLPLETLVAYAARALFHGADVWSGRAVYVSVRAITRY